MPRDEVGEGAASMARDRPRRGVTHRVRALQLWSATRAVALEVQSDLPELFRSFEVFVRCGRADGSVDDDEENRVWELLRRRHAVDVWARNFDAEVDGVRGACGAVIYRSVVQAELSVLDVTGLGAEDDWRYIPLVLERTVSFLNDSHYVGLRALQRDGSGSHLVQTYERATRHASREQIVNALVAEFTRERFIVTYDLASIESVFTGFYDASRVAIRRPPPPSDEDESESDEDVSVHENVNVPSAEDLYSSVEPPDAREARFMKANPVAALRGMLAHVHTKGSQISRELELSGDNVLSESDFARIDAMLDDTLGKDDEGDMARYKEFQARTDQRASIITCACCGARELHDSGVHMRFVNKADVFKFSAEELAIMNASERYMLNFQGFGVAVPLKDVLTWSEDKGVLYKVFPEVYANAEKAEHDNARRKIKKGDVIVPLCDGCHRTSHQTPSMRDKSTLLNLLCRNGDFGDWNRFRKSFNNKVTLENNKLSEAELRASPVELKLLGLGKLCATTFKVNAGFDASREAFKGHTISFVNYNRDVLEPISLLTADELAAVANVSIVGCEENVNKAMRKLNSEFVGSIAVREKTLYVLYHLIRQLRCPRVVNQKLAAMSTEDADLLRQTVFRSLFDDEDSLNASLFNAYEADESRTSFRRRAREALCKLRERVNRDTSDIAKTFESNREAVVSDVADVRTGDENFEHQSFVCDTAEEQTMSTLEAIAELKLATNRRCGRGSAPLSEYGPVQRSIALEALFPTLFLLPNSSCKIQPSKSAAMRTLAVFHDRRFTRDLTLLWYLYDRNRRVDTWRAASICTTQDRVERIQSILEQPNFDTQLETWIRAARKGESLPREARRLLNELTTGHVTNMSFTEELRTRTRKRLIDLQRFYGPSVLFWTIAPDDKGSSLMLRLGATTTTHQRNTLRGTFPDGDVVIDGNRRSFASECAALEQDADSILTLELGIQTKNDLVKFASQNPTATSLMFERLVKGLVGCALGIGPTVSRSSRHRALRKSGFFGVAGAAAFVVEANGRQSLHVHGLLYGTDCTPVLLRQLASRQEFVQKATAWIDKRFQREVPSSLAICAWLTKHLNIPINSLNSVALATTDQLCTTLNDATSLGQWVASMLNAHTHCASCWKGGRSVCRFGLPTVHDIAETKPATITEGPPPWEHRCTHSERVFKDTPTGLSLTACDGDIVAPPRSWGRSREDINGARALVCDDTDATVWLNRCRLTADTFDEEDARLRPKRVAQDNFETISCLAVRRLKDLSSFDALLRYLEDVESELNSPNAIALGLYPLHTIVEEIRRRASSASKDEEKQFFTTFHDQIQCANSYIAPFNPLISAICGSNTSMNFLGNAMSSTVATHYLTKYLSKASTELTEVLECLRRVRGTALSRQSTAPDADTAERKIKFILSRLANSVAAHREIPDTMIVSWALGLHSDFFSDAFVSVYGQENVRRAQRLLLTRRAGTENTITNDDMIAQVTENTITHDDMIAQVTENTITNDDMIAQVEHIANGNDQQNVTDLLDFLHNDAEDALDTLANGNENIANGIDAAQLHPQLRDFANEFAHIQNDDDAHNRTEAEFWRDSDTEEDHDSDPEWVGSSSDDTDSDSDSDSATAETTSTTTAAPRRTTALRAQIQRTLEVPSLVDADAVVQLRQDGSRYHFVALDNVMDYLARGHELRHLSLVEYVCTIRIVKRDHEDNDDAHEGDEDERDGPRKRKSRRPRSRRYELDASHPQASTHIQMQRQKNCVPQWAGKNPVPSLRAEGGERRSAEFLLVNFVPWSTLDELAALLADPHDTITRHIHKCQGTDASFVDQARFVLMRNVMSAFMISAEERVLHNAWRLKFADARADSDKLDVGHRANNEQHLDAFYVHEHNAARCAITDQMLLDAVRIAQMEPKSAEFTNRLQLISGLVGLDNVDAANTTATSDVMATSDTASRWIDNTESSVIERVKRTIDTNPSVNEDQEGAEETRDEDNADERTEVDLRRVDDARLTNDQERALAHALKWFSLVHRVKLGHGAFTVNPNNPSALTYTDLDQGQEHDVDFLRSCLLLCGGPGVGKTYFVDVLRRTIERNKLGSTLVVAPSATAAVLHKNGRTFHAAFSKKKKGGETTLERFMRGFDKNFSRGRANDLALLVLDEISMAHACWITEIDKKLRHWRSMQTQRKYLASLPFGGVLLICAGDFKQLPPVGGVSIAKALTMPNAVHDHHGATLVSSMSRIDLEEQVRARSDAEHARRVDSCRASTSATHSSFEEFFKALDSCKRAISPTDRIITTSNRARQAFNFVLAEKQARRDNGIVITWDEQILELNEYTQQQKQLIHQHEKAVSLQSVGIFVADGPALLNKNWSVPRGIVNGLSGVMKRLIYKDADQQQQILEEIRNALASRDELGRRNVFVVHVSVAPDGIVVDITDSVTNDIAAWNEATLEQGRVVIPVMCTDKTEMKYSSNFVTQVMGLSGAHVVRCGVDLAYALTAWRAQGQTIAEDVILWLPPEDASRCNGMLEPLYVVATRVRSSSQLSYLPWNSVVSMRPWYERWSHCMGMEFDTITDAFLSSYRTHDGIKLFDDALFRELTAVDSLQMLTLTGTGKRRLRALRIDIAKGTIQKKSNERTRKRGTSTSATLAATSS